MAAEQHGNDVAIQQLDPQPTVSIRGTIPTVDLAQHQGNYLGALITYLQQRGAQPAGPPCYYTFGETETDVELGIPVVEPVVGEGRIASGELPGGSAATIWHFGSHATLGNAYARLHTWLKEHGHEPASPGWELYYWIDPSKDQDPSTWSDASTWRTQLIQPITAANEGV